MPRQPKKPSERTSSSKLLEALKFLSFVTKPEGTPNETHIYLTHKTATAFNGILAAGQYIDEDLFACPHNQTMLNALSKCGQQFSIAQLDNGRLSVKSGKFKALVPCIDPALLAQPMPDNPIADIDDRFKIALEKLEPIKSEDDRITSVSFLLNGASLIATDGKILFESWHGLDLPPNLPIPKILIPGITKNNKRLCKFGFSNSSVTFYFEDGSWIRSQRYAADWPNLNHILDTANNPVSIPVDFFNALDDIAPFSENGNVKFKQDLLATHSKDAGANYEIPGLQPGPSFAIKYLQMIKTHGKQIDFYVGSAARQYDRLMFYGDNIRGVVMGHG